MITVALILVVSALLVAIAAAVNKAPLWVAVILLAIAAALQYLPSN